MEPKTVQPTHSSGADAWLLVALAALIAGAIAAFAFMPSASAAPVLDCTTQPGEPPPAGCGQVVVEKFLPDGAGGWTFTNSLSYEFTLTGTGTTAGTFTVPSSTLFNVPIGDYVATEQTTAGLALTEIFNAGSGNCCTEEQALSNEFQVATCTPTVSGSAQSAAIAASDFGTGDAPQTVTLCAFNHNTRNVHIIKEVLNHPGDTTPFSVSLNGTPLTGHISDSGDSIDVVVNGDIVNTFTEDEPLPAGYHFDFGTDIPPSPGQRCEPENGLTGVSTANGYELEAGETGDATVCLVNDEDPDVSITKTANPPGPVAAGNPIGFDITIANSGGGLPLILLSDDLDQSAGLHWSVDPPVQGCTIIGADGAQELQCKVVQLTGSETIHISSPTNTDVCGTYENSASWVRYVPVLTQHEAQVEGGTSNIASVTVDCGGSLTVTKHTLTNGLSDGAAVAFPWTFTVSSAACHYTSGPMTTVSGQVTFSNLPACDDYAISESGPLNGYVPIGSSPSSGSIVVSEGQTTDVTYLNVRQVNSGCPSGQLCTPPPPTLISTPTATPTTATPTATVPLPTATPTTPTATPTPPRPTSTTVSVVLGENTPSSTPRPPSTGSGSGKGSGQASIELGLLGFLVLSGGLATLTLSRRRRG